MSDEKKIDRVAEATRLMRSATQQYRDAYPNGAKVDAMNAQTHALLAIHEELSWLAPRMLGQVDPIPQMPANVDAVMEELIDGQWVPVEWRQLAPGLPHTLRMVAHRVIEKPDEGPSVVYADEIAAERQRQIAQGYTPAHDDEHGWRHLVTQIGYRVQSRLWGALGDADAREELVVMAALAVAGIEVIDRKKS